MLPLDEEKSKNYSVVGTLNKSYVILLFYLTASNEKGAIGILCTNIDNLA